MFRVIPELRLKGVDTQDLKDHSFLSTEINTGHSNGLVLFFLNVFFYFFAGVCLFLFFVTTKQNKDLLLPIACLQL